MKKKYLLSITILLAHIFTGCSTSDYQTDGSVSGKIRYEASVSDSLNYKLKIVYMSEFSNNTKTIIVESPYRYEFTVQDAIYLWLSVKAVPRVELQKQTTPNVTAKMFVNDKLFKESSDTISTNINTVYVPQ